MEGELEQDWDRIGNISQKKRGRRVGMVREREEERTHARTKENLARCMCVDMCVGTYVYVYVYMNAYVVRISTYQVSINPQKYIHAYIHSYASAAGTPSISHIVNHSSSPGKSINQSMTLDFASPSPIWINCLFRLLASALSP